MAKMKKTLTCACCGGDAPANKQFWNQDTGYGLCPRCALEMTEQEGAQYMRDTYGIAEVHYTLDPTH